MTNEKTGTTRKKLGFEFNGDGGDYFGIWIINSLLTLVTLGFYSPWAKVRKLQYFYGSTKIAGGSFQFLANPWSMLKFRIFAILLLIIYIMSEQLFATHDVAMIIYLSLFVLYLLFAPVLMVLMFSFRLRYSAWRSIRFSFNKDYRGAYRVYMAPNVVFLLVLISIFVPFYLSSVANETNDAGSETTTATESAAYDKTRHDNPVDIDDPAVAAGYNNDTQESDESNADEDGDTDEDSDTDYAEGYDDAYDEDAIYDKEADAENKKFDALLDGVEKEQFIPALTFLIIFVLLLPYFDFINTRFIARNARFGTAQCLFTATAKDYYWLYGKICLAGAGLFGAWHLNSMIDLSAVTVLLTCLSVVAFLYIKPYFKAKRYNLFFGHLHIGTGHRLRASANPLLVLWLSFSNSVGIMFSGGLLIPWAQIRTARYYLGVTHLESSGDLNEFLAGQEEKANALAEEISDVFDLEI
jgi:uncharacterized membrane protein YjgN (DUF898 family)